MIKLRYVPKAALEQLRLARVFVETQKNEAAARGVVYKPKPVGWFWPETRVHIIEKLCSEGDMDNAWKTLRKVFDDDKDEPDSGVFVCTCAYYYDYWKLAKRRTPAEHREYFQQIAKDLMDVAKRIVSEPEFGSLGMMGEAHASIVQMLDDEKIGRFMNWIEALPDGRSGRLFLMQLMPGFLPYATWLSERAEELGSQPPISARPNRQSAHRVFFQKKLAQWFETNFGEPMLNVVTPATNAIFRSNVSRRTVRGVVRP